MRKDSFEDDSEQTDLQRVKKAKQKEIENERNYDNLFKGRSGQDLTSSRFSCFTQGQNGVGSGT